MALVWARDVINKNTGKPRWAKGTDVPVSLSRVSLRAIAGQLGVPLDRLVRDSEEALRDADKKTGKTS